MEKQSGKKSGIGKKLLAYFLALSLLPVIIGGTISFYITKNQCEKNTKAHLSDLARDCGRKISYYVNSRYQDIKLLSQSYVFKGNDTQQKQNYIEEALKSYPFFVVITILDKNGKIIACTQKEYIGQSRADRTWFKKTIQSSQGDVIPLDAYRAETAGWKMVIGFNTPITDENNREIIGVLSTRVRMDHIIGRIKALDERIVGDNNAYLLNKRGEILAGPNEREFLNIHHLHESPVVKDLLAGKTGITAYKNDQGKDVISARYALEGDGAFNGWGWGIMMSEFASEAFKAAYIIRNTMIILALGIAFLVTMLAIFVSKKFSRPITEVSESALRISQGDLKPVKIHYDAKDEIGNLVGVFNKMAEDLRTTTVSRDSLTKEIAERKWAEEALKKSEEKLKNILHGSPIPTFVIDNIHRVIYWNKALEVYSGIKSRDIVRTDRHWKPFYNEKRPCMADLLVDGKIDDIPKWYPGKYRASDLIDGAYEAIDYLSSPGHDGKWLHFTAAPLKDYQGRLIGAVETLQDITETKKAEEQIKLLSRQNIEIQEREREALSREVHDNIGQLLSALKMGLSRTNKKIPGEFSAIKDGLSELSFITNKTIMEIRELSHALHPPLIEDLGLVSALEELCQDFKSYSEINITWDIEQIQKPLQSITNITIYRLFQEGLNNIVKHSRATKAYLTLTSSEREINAIIEDNGVGFLADNVLSPLQTKSLGLISMKERLALIGGELKIISSPGKGTKIIACLKKE
ncbi:MAG: HAMP domain-containing protein [Deltaproteobacteria bacterium]|nr:HAMP domain-containing protein [Deltaproteobacteria bacterium]